MNKLLLLALVVGGGGAALWHFEPFAPKGKKIESGKGVHTVQQRTLDITLKERGTLKTKKSTQIRSEISAKIEWIIEEGKNVKKDDILIKLDKKEALQQFEQYQNQITQLEAELESAKTELLIQLEQNKTDIEKAELKLEVARVEHTKLMESDIPTEERKLKLAIEEKKNAVEEARDQVTAAQELLKEEFATPYEVEKAKLGLKKALNDLQTAEMEWENYGKYTRGLEIKKKTSAVRETERALDQARKKADAQVSSKEAIVQQKTVSLKRVKIAHEKLQKQLEKMELKAPTAGTVLYGDPDAPWYREEIKVGSQIWNNMVLITLPDPSEMAVVIHVHEADIDKVKAGMKAFVTSETKKGEVYDGEIVKVDQVANAGRRWGRDNVKRFKVEVALSGTGLDLKTGTSARVELKLGELGDVVAVPLQAVFAKENSHFCFVLDGSRAQRREIELGKSNDSFVEIESGVAAGDRVLLYDPELDESTGGGPGSADGTDAE